MCNANGWACVRTTIKPFASLNSPRKNRHAEAHQAREEIAKRALRENTSLTEGTTQQQDLCACGTELQKQHTVKRFTGSGLDGLTCNVQITRMTTGYHCSILQTL